MNRTWWAAVAVAAMGLGGCAPVEKKVPTEVVGPLHPSAAPAATTDPVLSPNGITPPVGQCGGTLVCGIGASTGAQLGVLPNRPPTP